MRIDSQQLSTRDAYRLMISAIVPRPIAWVSSLSTDDQPNLAPFSFCMGVSADPPTLAIAVGRRRGELKDTAVNILATGEFVVHVACGRLAQAMVETSADVSTEINEFELAGLTQIPASDVRPPRIAEAPVAMECRLVASHDIGRGNTCLIIGEVVCFHVADALWNGHDIDIEALDPIGRLGRDLYTSVTDPFAIPRPVIDPETGLPRRGDTAPQGANDPASS